jgi:hypothetical protein
LAASNGTLFTAWRRDRHIYLAAPHEHEKLLGDGKDVALAGSGSKLFAVWFDGAGIRSWMSGQTELLSPEGAFPAIAPLPRQRAIAAWEEKGSIRMRLLE